MGVVHLNRDPVVNINREYMVNIPAFSNNRFISPADFHEEDYNRVKEIVKYYTEISSVFLAVPLAEFKDEIDNELSNMNKLHKKDT